MAYRLSTSYDVPKFNFICIIDRDGLFFLNKTYNPSQWGNNQQYEIAISKNIVKRLDSVTYRLPDFWDWETYQEMLPAWEKYIEYF